MNKTNDTDVREIPTVISDGGKIRLGAYTPVFPPPLRTPTHIDDNGKVRLGAFSPAFPPPVRG